MFLVVTRTKVDIYDLPRFLSIELVEFFLIFVLFVNADKGFLSVVFNVLPEISLQ